MRVGDHWHEVTLANVSATGLMVKCTEPAEIGSTVEIRHRGVTVSGRIVWTTHSRCALLSSDEIDLSALTAQSNLHPDRRQVERMPPTIRRLRARWLLWNGGVSRH